MSSRSRTKSASTTKDGLQTSFKDSSPSKTNQTREKSTKSEDHVSDFEKENRTRTARGKPKSQSKTTNDGKMKEKSNYCLCNQPDDGSPMVCCSACNEWYHFRCVKLSAEEASELEVYVCPLCTEKTGRRTISECHRSPFCSLLRRNARLFRPCNKNVYRSYEFCTYSLLVV
ncbi:hypothetical protein HYDPIDRAFT_88457 [Hydnomerulius pinastri MD-312]|nr:hypothetical protein HYDPIDRAFT_88457 [Hydnomerulius pinastri MD-312]